MVKIIINLKKVGVAVLLLALIGCATHLVQKSPNTEADSKMIDDDYTIEEIEIDSVCVEKARKYLSEKFDYLPNFHKGVRTKKMARALFFTKRETSENGLTILNEQGVYVVISPQCEVDSVQWTGPYRR